MLVFEEGLDSLLHEFVTLSLLVKRGRREGFASVSLNISLVQKLGMGEQKFVKKCSLYVELQKNSTVRFF